MDTSATSSNLSPGEQIHNFLMGRANTLRPATHYEVARFINARVKSYLPRLKYLGFDELRKTHGPGVGPHCTTDVPDELQKQLEKAHLVYVCHRFEPGHTGRGDYFYLTRRGSWLDLECTQYGGIWGWSWARNSIEFAGLLASMNEKRGDLDFGVDILKGMKDAYGRAREGLAERDALLAADMQSLELDIDRLDTLNNADRRRS